MRKQDSTFSFSWIRNHRILKNQTVAEATTIIIIITFLSKAVGYFREILVAQYFGATGQTDAFLIALLIPTMVFGLISSGLNILIIPVYIEKKNSKDGKVFVNQIFILWIGILLAVSLILFFFAPFFVKIAAYGFQGKRLSLSITLTRYLIPVGFSTVLIGFFTGLYQAERQFLYPIAVSFVANVLIVLSLFFLTFYLGLNSWTVGQLLFAILSFFALFWVLWKKKGFFQDFSLKYIQWAEIKNFIMLLFPLILSSGVAVLNQLIDRTIASTLQEGSIAVLNFAQITYSIPLSLLVVPLATAIYPTFSSSALNKDKNSSFAYSLQRTLSLVWYFIIPISLIFITLSEPLIRLLFQRGTFDAKATSLTSFATSMYSIGLFAYAANILLIRAFYSFKDTKIPLLLSLIIVGINIVGNITLSRILGAGGIALSTSISSSIGFFLYFFALRNRYFKKMNFRPLFGQVFKVALASILIGIFSLFLRSFLLSSGDFFYLLIKFILTGFLLALPYLFLSYIMKLEGSWIVMESINRGLAKIGFRKNSN